MKKLFLILTTLTLPFCGFTQIGIIENSLQGTLDTTVVFWDGTDGLNNLDIDNPVEIYGNMEIGDLHISNESGMVFNPPSDFNGMIGYYDWLYSASTYHIVAYNIVSASDIKLKKNIKPLRNALPIIDKLKPVTYDYNYDYSEEKDAQIRNKMKADDRNRIGFIAQDVQKILPHTVLTKESDSTLSIRIADFIPLLVKGMQEQLSSLDSLSTEIEKLKVNETIFKSSQINKKENKFGNEATLEQNTPNPFTDKTTIECFIPQEVNDARLLVFNTQGTLVKSYAIRDRNKTTVTIAGSELNAGIYIYSLIVDNKVVDSKRMILTKR